MDDMLLDRPIEQSVLTVNISSGRPLSPDSNYVNMLLGQYDDYIRRQAWKKVPRGLIHPAMVYDEADDLAQKIRIKLWRKLQQEPLLNPGSYINCIAHTETIDIVRRHIKSALLLTIDQESYQLDYGFPLFTSDTSTHDPAAKFEQTESLATFIESIVTDILTLPPRQRFSVFWVLKNEMSDLTPLVEALKNHGIDLASLKRLEDEKETQRLRSLLTIARKKLRMLRNNNPLSG